MTVSNIGISTQPVFHGSPAVVISPSNTPSGIELIWHSEQTYDSGFNDYWDIALNWQAAPKGITGADGGWSPWMSNGNGEDGTFYQRVGKEYCPHQEASNGGTDWNYDLNVASIFDELAPDGWSFASRMYDCIHVRIKMKAVYAEGLVDENGMPYSPTTTDEVWIVYDPKFQPTTAQFTGDQLAINYSTNGWTRRGSFNLSSIRDSNGIINIFTPVNATIMKAGTMVVPVSQLYRIPKDGTIYVSGTYVPSYDVPFDLITINGGASYDDVSTVNTPVLTVTVNQAGKFVSVRVTDSGDMGNPFDYAVVTLNGGGAQSDTQIVEPGQSAVFDPPYDVPLEFSCIAYSDTAVSKVVTATAAAISGDGRMTIRDEYSGEMIEVLYNIDLDRSSERETVKQKFAGRTRSSVFFGTGADVTRTVGFTIFRGSPEQTFVESMSVGGTLVVRTPDGDRFEIAPDSVDWTRNGEMLDVTISGTEVSSL